MKLYLTIVALCLIGFGITETTMRSELSALSEDELGQKEAGALHVMARAAHELRGQVYGALTPAEKRQAQARYASTRAYYRVIWLEYVRRAINPALAMLLLLVSLIAFGVSLRRWIKDRKGQLELANGSIEVLTTEVVPDTEVGYLAAKGVLFQNKRAALHYLRKSAPHRCAYCEARNDGGVLGQVWKRQFRLKIEGQDEPGRVLGTCWAANVATPTACPSCGRV